MTKEITKAKILQELEDRFKLRELIPEKFTFSETVVPIYDIAPHLIRWETIFYDRSITAETSYYFFDVPQNERWTLTHYNVVFMAAGAYTVSGVFISRNTGVHPTDIIYLDLKEGQTVSYAVNLNIPVILNPRDRIYVLIDGFTSTADLRMYINVRKEELR